MEENLQFSDFEDCELLHKTTNAYDLDLRESDEEFDGQSEGDSDGEPSMDSASSLFPFIGNFRSKGTLGASDTEEHFSEFGDWPKRTAPPRRWQELRKGYDTDSDSELHEFGRYDTDGSDTEALNVSYSTPDSSTFTAFFSKLTDKDGLESKERLRQRYKSRASVNDHASASEGSSEEDGDDTSDESSEEETLSESDSSDSDSEDETVPEENNEDMGDETDFSKDKLLEQATREYEEKRNRRHDRFVSERSVYSETPRLKLAIEPTLRSTFSFGSLPLSTLVELLLITSDMILMLK